ncbi:winged helix-turn-helix transcriptional regulator [Actinomadura opuntiae]|uniref:winged helix-turn-helix transcriptional regulator n=1 Tax=Actinomadura sp. OS1-43 TaxID=604315 RepID=UPI00255AA54B|nr:winged helix-turn-helix transcriptional regulator [Actinomadura sp. OS1-43]MDL4817343.1 winged helix-turn-helix transcriptional regulator [Actinomadura sp. OS1-43]
MARRTYDQFCGLARALDVVGERWTLLIVRELMSGPKRYSDLAAALEGIGTSLLASRVRQLEADRVVTRRRLPPPIASTVYELTAIGTELAQAIMPLALWGARHHTGDGRAPADAYRAEWTLAPLAHLLPAEAIRDIEAVYEFHIDDSTAHLRIQDGRVHIVPGAADGRADVTIRSGSSTLAAIAAGRLDLTEALQAGHVEADGAAMALATLLKLLQAHLQPLIRLNAGS